MTTNKIQHPNVTSYILLTIFFLTNNEKRLIKTQVSSNSNKLKTLRRGTQKNINKLSSFLYMVLNSTIYDYTSQLIILNKKHNTCETKALRYTNYQKKTQTFSPPFPPQSKYQKRTISLISTNSYDNFPNYTIKA